MSLAPLDNLVRIGQFKAEPAARRWCKTAPRSTHNLA